MSVIELTCIGCPMGCLLTVTLENNAVTHVTGHSCKIGVDYAHRECTSPTRLITSTLLLKDGLYPLVPVKTQSPIPKHMIFECMRALKDVVINAPVQMGDVLYENICDTGVAIVATQSIPKNT